jgi:hypothetical protein
MDGSPATPLGWVVGALGGALWVGLAFVPASIAGSERYEALLNRLWTPALIGMLVAFACLYRLLRPARSRWTNAGLTATICGLSVMIAANIVEYWFLSDWSHVGPDAWARGSAWVAFLLGFAVVLVALETTGVALIRSPAMPTWLGIAFAATMPLTILGGWADPSLAGLAFGCLAVVASVYGLRLPRDNGTIARSPREAVR